MSTFTQPNDTNDMIQKLFPLPSAILVILTLIGCSSSKTSSENPSENIGDLRKAERTSDARIEGRIDELCAKSLSEFFARELDARRTLANR